MPILIGTYKNLFKAIPYLIIIGLTIALSVTQCSKQEVKTDNYQKEFQSRIQAKEKQLTAIQADGEVRRKQWVKDSLEMKHTSDSLKKAAFKATKERDQARAKIQEIVNSNPEVKEFVELDSVSDKINLDRINALELDKLKISDDCRAMMGAKDDEIKIAISLKNDFQNENKDLSKQVKKQRNLKTFYKIAFGIAVGALIFQSFN